MALSSKDKKKIKNSVEKILPEFNEKERILGNIQELLNEIVYNQITENELKYYELYPDKCYVGLEVNFRNIRYELDVEELKTFHFIDTYRNPDYYKQYLPVYFPGTSNPILNIYRGKESFWKELKKSDLNNFLKLKKLIMNFCEVSNKWHTKVSSLDEVLNLQDLTLTDLKNLYPELYKIAKQ